jgi:hypothetical protein
MSAVCGGNMSFRDQTRTHRSLAGFTPLHALMLTACLLISCLGQAQSAHVSAGYRVAGVVVSKNDGHPVSRARVILSAIKDSEKAAWVITGDDGRFEFTDVPAGKYSLYGSKRGFASSYYDQHENFWTGIVTGAGVDTENLVLKLTPSAVIAGQVLDESGDPVRNARITLYRVDHSEGIEQIRTMRNAQTDDLGGYEFASLKAGTYFVSASAKPWYAVHPEARGKNADDSTSNFDRTLDVTYPVTYYADTTDTDSATPIPIRGGEHLQADLHLNPVPALRLIFHVAGDNRTDGGFNLPRLEQPSFDGSTPVESGSVRMISPGVVEMSGIPAGRYDIHLGSPVGGIQLNGVDLTQDGQQINTSTADNLSDVKLSARMSDGTPLSKQLSVGLISGNRIYPGGVVLDEKGQAELSQLAAGSYRLLAWDNGKPLFISQISAEGAAVTGHTVRITPGASVSLSLTLSSDSAEVEGVIKHAGKPFAGAMVVLVPKDSEGNGDLFRRDQSDLDGTFALHNVIPGSYVLIAIENGWDLDWSQPNVIAAYAKHGRVVQIANGSKTTLHIPDPIEVQPK